MRVRLDSFVGSIWPAPSNTEWAPCPVGQVRQDMFCSLSGCRWLRGPEWTYTHRIWWCWYIIRETVTTTYQQVALSKVCWCWGIMQVIRDVRDLLLLSMAGIRRAYRESRAAEKKSYIVPGLPKPCGRGSRWFRLTLSFIKYTPLRQRSGSFCPVANWVVEPYSSPRTPS